MVKYTLYFRLNALYILILDNNKVFISFRFMHKVNWMKTEWDQARFSLGITVWGSGQSLAGSTPTAAMTELWPSNRGGEVLC